PLRGKDKRGAGSGTMLGLADEPVAASWELAGGGEITNLPPQGRPVTLAPPHPFARKRLFALAQAPTTAASLTTFRPRHTWSRTLCPGVRALMRLIRWFSLRMVRLSALRMTSLTFSPAAAAGVSL